MISPEEEFMGHCSNIQAFFENGLNTDILHTNIAFPLLKKLVDQNFEPARRVFKQEIAVRFNEGTQNSRYFLNSGGYLNYLNEEEKQALISYDSTRVHSPSYFNYLFKIVILGDDNVGKSTMARNCLNSRDYDSHFIIGVNFATKNITLNNHFVKLQIWFLSDLKRHQELFKNYLHGTLGAIIMYDVTKTDSLNNLPKWIQIIKANRFIQSRKDFPIMLVGNKKDLERNRVVSKEKGNEIKEKYGLSLFIEASLKTGEDVDVIFRELSNLILKKFSLTNSTTKKENSEVSKGAAMKELHELLKKRK